jgi:RNA polymerase-binding transcription factor DksA
MNTGGGGSAWKMTPDSPAVQNDAEGHFMKCGRCSKRIAIEKRERSSTSTWTVSAQQSCDRVLP